MEGLLVIIGLAWIAVSMMIAVHADGQGKTSLWGVLVFVTGIFGLLGYAISLGSD